MGLAFYEGALANSLIVIYNVYVHVMYLTFRLGYILLSQSKCEMAPQIIIKSKLGILLHTY